MTDSEVLQLILENRPLMDVRAPVEFNHGSIPGATNLFLLNDDERAQVGTTYKVEGSDSAVRLGHQIISGKTLDERLAGWMAFARANSSAVGLLLSRGDCVRNLFKAYFVKMESIFR